MTNGMPGSVTPAAWKPGARRSAMYQMFGSLRPRCMSFESKGLPLAVCVPEITQLLEPGIQPEQERFSRADMLTFVESNACARRLRMDGAPKVDGARRRVSVRSSSSSPGEG